MSCVAQPWWTLPFTWLERLASWFGLEGCGAYFHSPAFLLLLLPLALLMTALVAGSRIRLALLAWISVSFYALFDYRFIPLLFASSLVDFLVARRIPGSSRPKAWLLGSLAVNLGLLGVFKYLGFFVGTANGIVSSLGWDPGLTVHLILPVGISFYTFQTISYTVDVYRGQVTPTRDFLRYFAYVTMFPQLVAGPIVRYQEIEPQLIAPTRPDQQMVAAGMRRFAWGMAKKVVVADTIAGGLGRLHPGIDTLWQDPSAWTGFDGIIAVLGYSAQLYFDFSGYSDMALGLGMMLGFRFPENFNRPYRARDPSDFWRRWHVTLGRFLRDYLYVPLGGNRAGPSRTLVNVSLVMFLGGLWHGAAWTFVVWGLYHGALLVLYNVSKPMWDRLPGLAARTITFGLVAIGWIPFRASSLSDAGTALQNLIPSGPVFGGVAVVPIAFALWFAASGPAEGRSWTQPRRWQEPLLGALMALTVVGLTDGTAPFLYYQF